MEPRLTVTGNVGLTPTHRTIPSGTHVAEFSVAYTRRVIKEGQWGDGPTTWLNVRCFGKLAENVTSSVHKGDPVVVSGRVEVDSWNPPEGGTRTKTWLVADALGHDLARGTTKFERAARASGGSDDSPTEPTADAYEPDIEPAQQRRAS